MSATPPAGATPSAARATQAGTRAQSRFIGDAPWALSALPECLLQRRAFRAPSAAGVLRHLPAGSVRVRAGTTLAVRDCTISTRAGDLEVRRGADRFHIPPPSVLYEIPGGYALLHADGGAELRLYALSKL